MSTPITLVASLIEADWLFILTDVDRLYSADPRLFPEAAAIARVTPAQLAQLSIDAGSSGSQWGTGGMATKLAAARIATSAGVEMAITRGRQPGNILKIMAGEAIGTRFEAQKRSDNARKRWIAYGLMPMGKIYLDAGAIQAICQGGKSLLAAGITKVEGEFSASESVQLCDQERPGSPKWRGNLAPRNRCNCAIKKAGNWPGELLIIVVRRSIE